MFRIYCVISEAKICSSEEFTCKSANGECIPLAWMCDMNRDCTDGSDEAQCSKYDHYSQSYFF